MPDPRVPASSEPRPENPYTPKPKPILEGDLAGMMLLGYRRDPREDAWDEGFVAGRAAFDAVVAERDRAIEQREQAATSRNVIAAQRDQALDRLTRWEREGDKHWARPATEKLVSLTREGEEWAAEQQRQDVRDLREAVHDVARVKAAEGRRLSHLERALEYLRGFVQDGEVRRIIDAALAGRDWDA